MSKSTLAFIAVLAATGACKPRDFNSTEGDTASAADGHAGECVLKLKTENSFSLEEAEKAAYWWNLYRQNKDNLGEGALPGKATIVRCDGEYFVMVEQPSHREAFNTLLSVVRRGGSKATPDYKKFTQQFKYSYLWHGSLSEYSCGNKEYIIPTWDPLKK